MFILKIKKNNTTQKMNGWREKHIGEDKIECIGEDKIECRYKY
jgi:hypothetical protein